MGLATVKKTGQGSHKFQGKSKGDNQDGVFCFHGALCWGAKLRLANGSTPNRLQEFALEKNGYTLNILFKPAFFEKSGTAQNWCRAKPRTDKSPQPRRLGNAPAGTRG